MLNLPVGPSNRVWLVRIDLADPCVRCSAWVTDLGMLDLVTELSPTGRRGQLDRTGRSAQLSYSAELLLQKPTTARVPLETCGEPWNTWSDDLNIGI
ncbi:hypothetical protein U1Q18_021774 [Sarracenia purpurea var. burkii]